MFFFRQVSRRPTRSSAFYRVSWLRDRRVLSILFECPFFGRYQCDRLVPAHFIGSAGFTNPASAKSKAQANIITTNKWQPTPAWFRTRTNVFFVLLPVSLPRHHQYQHQHPSLVLGASPKKTFFVCFVGAFVLRSRPLLHFAPPYLLFWEETIKEFAGW